MAVKNTGKRLFLIGFYKIEKINDNGTETGSNIRVKPPKFITKSFIDEIDAKAWASDNINMYINPRDKYIDRTFSVNDYAALADEGRERSELLQPVINNLTQNLNPVLQDYCYSFWNNPNSIAFMERLLGYKDITNNEELLFSPEALSKISKYIADIFMRERKTDLSQFFRKITDDLLRTQIEHKIILFIKTGSVEESHHLSLTEDSMTADSI